MFTPRSNPSRLTRMKSRGRSLEPGRHHQSVVVPDGRESLPVPRVAPQRPVLDELADQPAILDGVAARVDTHVGAPVTPGI